jgi:hypothetical protein
MYDLSQQVLLLLYIYQAQVQSSDALKNVPFVLSGTSSQGESVVFQGNKEIVSTLPLPSTSPSPSSHPQHHLVQIDKSVLNSIAIGSYSISEEIQHMPLVSEVFAFVGASAFCHATW